MRSFSFQDLVNSRLGITFALAFGRYLPPSVGHRLAAFAADRVSSRRNLELVQVVRANQWVANNEQLTRFELDEAVRDNFRFTARSIYDVYHHLNNSRLILELVEFTPNFDAMLERNHLRQEGTVVVIPHMSNFDLVGIGAGIRGMRSLGLGFPQPTGGYEWQNELRNSFGMEAMPTTRQTLRKASEWLRSGGTVLTGIDRPVPDSNLRLSFFGRPASLPLHHIMLALKADVPILVAAVITKLDGKYSVETSEFIRLRRFPDRRKELLENAQSVLDICEGFIRKAPRQWAMYYPVWPEINGQVP